MKIFLLLALTFYMTGCSSYKPEPHITSDGEGVIFSSDTAALSTTKIQNGNNLHIICKAPPPDASFSEASGLNLEFSIVKSTTQNSKNNEGGSQSVNELELAGRTPSVLLAREVFFRTCEFSDNFKLTKEEALVIFNKSLDTVGQNWALETNKTTINITDLVSGSNKIISNQNTDENNTKSNSETSN